MSKGCEKNQTRILSDLIANREANIEKLIKWSLGDFNEMLDTYGEAKLAATVDGDVQSIDILNEKISQLEQARFQKESSNDGELGV